MQIANKIFAYFNNTVPKMSKTIRIQAPLLVAGKGLMRFLFPLLTLMCLSSGLIAQVPIVEVDGFRVGQVNILGVRYYEFVPTCGGGDCSSTQLGHHLFHWEFGLYDRSVEVRPRRLFYSGAPITISLRVTGIKEYVDPDRTIPPAPDPDPANNYYNELPPASWVTKPPIRKPLNPTPTPPPPLTAVPSISVEVPSHAPIPNEPYTYLLVVDNFTNCPQSIVARMVADVSGAPLRIARDLTGPAATCIVGGDNDCRTIRVQVPKTTHLAIPLTVRIPEGRDWIGRTARFEAEIDSRAESGPCPGDTVRVSNSQLVERAVDPNQKWCHNGTMHFPGTNVEFAIQFKNEGNANVHSVVITDTLDARLRAGEATIVSVEANGVPLSEFVAGLEPSYYRFSPGLPGNVVQCLLTLAPSDALHPLDSGIVVFSVPIDPAFNAKPGDIVEEVQGKCALLVTVPNRAVSMFPEEGVGYGVDCRPPLQVVLDKEDCKPGTVDDNCCPQKVCIALAVLVVLLLLLVVWLWRRARQN